MLPFTNWEKEILEKIISSGADRIISMKQLLEEFYFMEAKSRALIIQKQNRYAVFFLHNEVFNDENIRKEELEKFLELIGLINYLRFQGYISLYKDEFFLVYNQSFCVLHLECFTAVMCCPSQLSA